MVVVALRRVAPGGDGDGSLDNHDDADFASQRIALPLACEVS
jgi:hypothetical protein